jgi:hypothetical protein
MAALLETERENADSFFASAPPLQDRELITSDVQKFVSRRLQLGMSGSIPHCLRNQNSYTQDMHHATMYLLESSHLLAVFISIHAMGFRVRGA